MTAIRTIAFALSALVLAACPAQVKDTDWDSETDTDTDTDSDTDSDTDTDTDSDTDTDTDSDTDVDTDTDTDSDTDTDTDTGPPDPIVWTLTAQEWTPPPQTDEVAAVGYQTGSGCPLFYNEEDGPEWSYPRCHSTGLELTLDGPPADGAVYPVYLEYKILVKEAFDEPAYQFDPTVDGDVMFNGGWVERYELGYWGRWGEELWAGEGEVPWLFGHQLSGIVLLQPGAIVDTRHTVDPLPGDVFDVGDRWFALCVNAIQVVGHETSAEIVMTEALSCEYPDSLRWILNTDSEQGYSSLRRASQVSRRAPAP